MAAVSLRYFGVRLAELDVAQLRVDSALGRFCPIAEPLPVGTKVELGGESLTVMRVDESATPGIWVSAQGIARAPMDEMPTMRDAKPASLPAALNEPEEPEEPEESEENVISMIAEPPGNSSTSIPVMVDHALAPELPAPDAPEDGTPDEVKGEETAGGKRKRRPRKTVIGR